MMNTSRTLKILSLTIAALVFTVIAGATDANAQRDPFAKRGGSTTTTKPNPNPSAGNPNPSTGKPEKPVKAAPAPVAAPSIEQRIEYYKRMRENAAMNGEELPKVTSVLTLSEMSVTGIFKTPRGYGAMVEAVPIKLSYTIYPGEKFFDGQLVAIEENRLIFRKIIKMSNGKFISSVENKPLREYSMQETIQGTAPVDQSGTTQTANATPPPAASEEGKTETAPPTVVVSPLEEMNNQPAEKPEETEKGKSKKAGKKPAKKGGKVAKKQ